MRKSIDAELLFTRLRNYRGGKRFLNMDDPMGLNGEICEVAMHVPWTYKRTDGWDDLHCPDVRNVGPFRIKTTCRTPDGKGEFLLSDPSLYKVFVKLPRRRLRNLYDYVRLLRSGTISHSDHLALMGYLEAQRRRLVIASGTHETVVCFNHNLDVGVLHFKYRCADNYKCA